MKKAFTLFCLLVGSLALLAQNNYPVVGVSDERPHIYGFRNATVVVDHNQTITGADILVVNGRIEAVGAGLTFPKGTVIEDLKGKTVYPSFIDIFTSYGMPEVTRESGANAFAALMGGQRQSAPTAESPRVADYWNQGIHESYNAVSEFKVDNTRAGEMRKAGFGTVLSGKNDGIARGTSALVLLTDNKAQEAVIMERASANYSFVKGSSEDMYPAAQYGSIALLRQFCYDAKWYTTLPKGYFFDASLEAMNKNGSLPKIFEVRDKYEIPRVNIIAGEFGMKFIIKGSGDEYQLLDEIKKTGMPLVLPLNFPAAPDVKDPFDAASVGLSTLKHWEMAPANAYMVSKAGIPFAFTATGLTNVSEFLANLRKATEEGLDRKEALKALTYTPASLIGATNMVGAIKKGMIANFLVCSGDIFDKDCIIYENWVEGKPFILADKDAVNLAGSYTVSVDTSKFDLTITGTPDRPTARVRKGESTLTSTIAVANEQVTISITTDQGIIRLSAPATEKGLAGEAVLQDGSWAKWTAVAAPGGEGGAAGARGRNGDATAEKSPIGKVVYPFVAYGWEEKPVQETILFTNATVWTLEGEGIIENCDVLVENGKIAAVGKGLRPGKARVIDATGMHLTPGIIDEHSHIAMSASNEMGQAITSEVRVADIIDPSDQSLYRQLSGGVTAAHILHGSANPIGGQSVIIKHRWGSSAEEMKVAGQVGFLKHALGENVKRTTSRYPNTRMGTEHIIRDAYTRALDYQAEWKTYNALPLNRRAGVTAPRRDLELDALVDVLEKRSFMTCHTYVQSEGTMIIRLAEDFGIKAHTLIHFNEAYKIADKMAAHGAAGSVFSDWWNYKYEVYEGTAYNAGTLLKEGVLTCLHSDNAELARRLNQEAGKIVKYSGIDQVEALKLVTLNTAKILHLDDRMGSIREGKDADIVLWTGNPLSMYSRASKTLVDGIVYFDEEKDAEMKAKVEEERNRIIQKILKEGGSTGTSRAAGMMRRGTN